MEQKRYKSWAMWLGLISAVWTVLAAFDVPQMIGLEEGAFMSIVNAIGAVLIAFGIVNNPTDSENI